MNDGNAATDARLKSHVHPFPGSGGKNFLAMERQQCFVGRDDRFPGGNGVENQALGKIISSDQLNDDIDGGIPQDLLRIVHEHAGRKANAPIPGDVEIGDADQLDRHAHAPTDERRILEQDLDDAGSDGAEADDSDADARDHSVLPSSFKVFLMPRTACLVRCSFSTSAKRTYSSPPSPNPMPGETATLASRSSSLENSREPI